MQITLELDDTYKDDILTTWLKEDTIELHNYDVTMCLPVKLIQVHID